MRGEGYRGFCLYVCKVVYTIEIMQSPGNRHHNIIYPLYYIHKLRQLKVNSKEVSNAPLNPD